MTTEQRSPWYSLGERRFRSWDEKAKGANPIYDGIFADVIVCLINIRVCSQKACMHNYREFSQLPRVFR